MTARSREQALTALAPLALMRYLLCDQPVRLSNVLLLSQQSFGHTGLQKFNIDHDAPKSEYAV